MAWRRGFFRLWMIGSAVFVIAVAVINYSEIREQFDAAAEQADQDERVLPVRCRDARGVLGTDFYPTPFDEKIPAVIRSQENPNPWDTCWYTRASKFRLFYPEYKDLSDTALSSKLFAAQGIPWRDVESPWTVLLNYIGIAFGIPLIVLILGAALAWALSGFKLSTPRA